MGSLIFPQRHGTACQRRRIKNERPPISSMRQEIGGRVSGSSQFSHRFFLPLQDALDRRSEEHTSGLQSLMRISYAVFCLKKTLQDNLCKIQEETASSKSEDLQYGKQHRVLRHH